MADKIYGMPDRTVGMPKAPARPAPKKAAPPAHGMPKRGMPAGPAKGKPGQKGSNIPC